MATKCTYVKMDPKDEREALRKAARYLIQMEGYSNREVERVLKLHPRNGMGIWDMVNKQN